MLPRFLLLALACAAGGAAAQSQMTDLALLVNGVPMESEGTVDPAGEMRLTFNGAVAQSSFFRVIYWKTATPGTTSSVDLPDPGWNGTFDFTGLEADTPYTFIVEEDYNEGSKLERLRFFDVTLNLQTPPGLLAAPAPGALTSNESSYVNLTLALPEAPVNGSAQVEFVSTANLTAAAALVLVLEDDAWSLPNVTWSNGENASANANVASATYTPGTATELADGEYAVFVTYTGENRTAASRARAGTLTVDTTTVAPSIYHPALSYYIFGGTPPTEVFDTFDVVYELPEMPLEGSVKLEVRTEDATDVLHTFANLPDAHGSHVTFRVQGGAADMEVNDDYMLRLSYKDHYGNPVASTDRKVRFRTVDKAGLTRDSVFSAVLGGTVLVVAFASLLWCGCMNYLAEVARQQKQ